MDDDPRCNPIPPVDIYGGCEHEDMDPTIEKPCLVCNHITEMDKLRDATGRLNFKASS